MAWASVNPAALALATKATRLASIFAKRSASAFSAAAFSAANFSATKLSNAVCAAVAVASLLAAA